MSKIEFYKEFEELCKYYGSKICSNKKIVALYYAKVKDMTIDEFRNKINFIILNSKFMPRVADFDNIDYVKYRNYEQRQYTKEFLESFYEN